MTWAPPRIHPVGDCLTEPMEIIFEPGGPDPEPPPPPPIPDPPLPEIEVCE